MMKRYFWPFLLVAAMLTSTGIAMAQAQTGDTSATSATQQTDRSEDVWRKSKKKRTISDPFSSITNTSSSGIGAPLPPLSAMQKLPEESRRHLKRQRAKVIASMKFGKDDKPVLDKNAGYQPSEAAKKDPQLASDEKEAWQVILTDLQGGGKGDASGPGGSNKVAVTGRGGDQTGSVLRGGSTQSAAEIMARLKGLKPGAVSGGADTSGQKPGQNQDQSKQAKTDQQRQQQTLERQTASNTGSASDSKTQQKPPSALRGGSAQSTSDILSTIKNDTGTQSGGQSTSQSSQSAQSGQQGKQASTGKSGQSGKGQNGDQGGQPGNGAAGGQGVKNAETAEPDPLDPLNLPIAATTDTKAPCAQSSAYAYLKKNKTPEEKPAGCP